MSDKPEYQWRVTVYPDSDYQHDCDHDSEEDAAECARLAEVYGAWGFVTERLVAATEPCVTCKHSEPQHWEDVDSCWGFVEAESGMPYMMSQAVFQIPAGESYAVCSGDNYSRKVTVEDVCIKKGNDSE